MKIALIQTELIWENPTQNRKRLEGFFVTLSEKVDVVVLPEMFTSGFTMHPKNVAETMEQETVLWMKQWALKINAALVGSVVIETDGNYTNRLLFVEPNGKVTHYDKRHLFSLAHEDEYYAKGMHKQIITYRGLKFCPLICYDLRFPVFSRNTENYDVLLYVANWPSIRIAAWDALLKARAIENMCYVIGVNRVGVDPNNLEYNGHTQALDFLGNYLLTPQEKEGVYLISITTEEMYNSREKLSFLRDRDSFEIIE